MSWRLPFFILISTFFMSCEPPDQIVIGKIFSLNLKENKSNSVEDIEISFNQVLNESRCQPDTICVWEGNAEVELSFRKDLNSETSILNTSLDPMETILFGYSIKLISLNFPEDPEDYTITLIIDKENSRCTNNDSCPHGFFCKKEPGKCDKTGIQTIKPEACVTIYDPVCGCDGKTYGNACEANSAGVSVDHKGECPSLCQPVMCEIYCKYGFKVDENGCEICECIEIDCCETVDDCACGIDIINDDCAVGNREFINTSESCPDFCGGIDGQLKIKCIEKHCTLER